MHPHIGSNAKPRARPPPHCGTSCQRHCRLCPNKKLRKCYQGLYPCWPRIPNSPDFLQLVNGSTNHIFIVISISMMIIKSTWKFHHSDNSCSDSARSPALTHTQTGPTGWETPGDLEWLLTLGCNPTSPCHLEILRLLDAAGVRPLSRFRKALFPFYMIIPAGGGGLLLFLLFS